MKKIKTSFDLNNKYCFRYCCKILFIILAFNSLAQGKSECSELISLNTNNEPLAEVLDSVSQASGYEFIIDENWDDLPISVSFNAMTLEQALKRILANVNHAIVYNSDRKVFIRIYEKDSSISRDTGAPAILRVPPEATYRSLPIETPTSPNPVPPETISEDAEPDDSESEDSELSSRQSKTIDEENESKDDVESSDKGGDAQDNN
ncbi:MAG: hypothetical protein JRF72_12725 [Deltaproteobacteria bacterium]|jgi:type II secretory pathway component GspD/PulD (secretin)|nr:hypothetical protein [Deltaproteobacteria bacterium]